MEEEFSAKFAISTVNIPSNRFANDGIIMLGKIKGTKF
jgi:hypothetical protein